MTNSNKITSVNVSDISIYTDSGLKPIKDVAYFPELAVNFLDVSKMAGKDLIVDFIERL